MEYCKTTLREVLDAAGPVDADSAWWWLRQMLEGLGHIHAQGMSHRDLKPSNVFLDAQGRLKIGDFGLAKFDAGSAAGADGGADGGGGGVGGGGTRAEQGAGLSEPTGAVGTFLYIAPEISAGLPHDSKAGTPRFPL